MDPRLNLQWHDEHLVYSDGTIEQDILASLLAGRSDEEILQSDDRWPILYHFSPQRHHIVSWMEIQPGSTVLEIGSGLGAVTGAFCARKARVTCIELSLTRSRINLLRHQDCNDLEVIVANLSDIPADRTYDLVTLIGVLEYSGRYMPGPDPYREMLRKAASFVRPGGRLVIAIENRLGLKYLAGAREDHIGQPYYGLNGYRDDDGIRTFARSELEALLERSGLDQYQLYLPFPDYKFPSAIVSADAEAFFPEALAREDNYGAYAFETFDIRRVQQDLIREDSFVSLANSFLYIARIPES